MNVITSFLLGLDLLDLAGAHSAEEKKYQILGTKSSGESGRQRDETFRK